MHGQLGLYFLGVSYKSNQDSYKFIFNGLGFRVIIHSFIQTKGMGNLLILIHAFVTITNLTLITDSIIWQ